MKRGRASNLRCVIPNIGIERLCGAHYNTGFEESLARHSVAGGND
jgi:hypothetical protein